jgi:DNA-binding NtrC family response regulator
LKEKYYNRHNESKSQGTQKSVVLIAEDDNTSRRILSHFVQKIGYIPILAEDGEECIKQISEQRPDVILLDINMPKKDGFEVMQHMKAHGIFTPVIMITASHDIPHAVKCIKLGAYEYLTKPLSIERLEIVMRNALAESSLISRVQKLQKELESQNLFKEIIGQSASIKQAMEQVVQVMETDLNVLILGESGSGKELFAEAIHYGSKRKNGPFVSVNCATISSNLADSLLFGHVKGAFTGANNDHTGFFEQADKGTIFLDEIGDMSSDIQAKVLRVLQERKIRKVGEKREKSINFRVISATNNDFSQAIKNNLFREDLYYRLEEFPLFIPPLRERVEDIPLLVKHFLVEFASANNLEPLQLEPNALAEIEGYQWPGNIRELKNAVQRAAVTRKGNIIETVRLPLIRGSAQTRSTERDEPESALEPAVQKKSIGSTISGTLEEHEREVIIQACKASFGNLTKTAKMLGIGRATLYRKLEKFGLDYLKTG